VFVADTANGNYVGNYPPGYMTTATVNIQSGSVLRDMGKTIKAGIGSGSPLTIGSEGFWREVQVIAPTTQPNNFALGTSGVGVNGVGAGLGVPGQLPAAGNPGDDGYCTYYVPITVNGIIAGGVTSSYNGALLLGNVQ
jgi:hypothetical protein